MTAIRFPPHVSKRVDALLRNRWTRLFVALSFLALHLWAMAKMGQERFGLSFNSDPGHPPAFGDAHREAVPANWNRLLSSRWDSQHYISLTLRGFSACPDRSELGPTRFPEGETCEVNFYPGLPMMGRLLLAVVPIPVDYALFAICLLASLAFLYMWTSPIMMEGLGVGGAYLSLLLYNAFTTGYQLVTIQTEPCTLAFTLASFLLLQRRRYLAGSIMAGAATGVRITAAASGFAFSAALLAITILERTRRPTTLLWRALLCLLSLWGLLALMGYDWHRFGDPLAYSHAHGRVYGHQPNPFALFALKPKWIVESIQAIPNESIWLAAGLIWFALGHRSALYNFDSVAKVYWYVLTFFAVAIPAVGQVELSFSGLSRYVLLGLPIFFAMASVLRRRPAALVLWLGISLLHYWNVNMCFYVGHTHPERLKRCSFTLVP